MTVVSNYNRFGETLGMLHQAGQLVLSGSL